MASPRLASSSGMFETQVNKRARIGSIEFQESRSGRPEGFKDVQEMWNWPTYTFHQLFLNDDCRGRVFRWLRFQKVLDAGTDDSL